MSRRTEIFVFAAVFGVAAFLRLFSLSADPPGGLSISNGINTDPPVYTLNARNEILSGNWNLYGETTPGPYSYSVIAGTGWVIYRIFGLGTAQSNLIGSLLSLASLVLLYFIVRRIFGCKAALLTLLLLAVNHIAVFYGRRPFLENGMIFLLILGLFFLSQLESKKIGHVIFGVCVAGAVLFGKSIALAFLPAVVVYYSHRFMVGDRRRAMVDLMAMIGGAGMVLTSWAVLLFHPGTGDVIAAIRQMVFGPQVYPDGFKSPAMYLWKFFGLGPGRDAVYLSMPFLATAGMAGILVIAGRLLQGNTSGGKRRTVDPLAVAMVVWPIVMYAALVPWNYNPLRYQTVLIYPLTVLAAVALVSVITSRGQGNPFNRSPIFAVILTLSLIFLICQTIETVARVAGIAPDFISYFIGAAALGGIGGSVYSRMATKSRRMAAIPAGVRYAVFAVVVIGSLGYHVRAFTSWVANRSFSTQTTSRDIGRLLPPDAVLCGPYAPALVMDNRLGCVGRFFGDENPDTAFFELYPVTHLVLDESNEAWARQTYVSVMRGAVEISAYDVNGRTVRIYRIRDKEDRSFATWRSK